MFDFRSDTVTQPTPEMLEAMRTAPVGDDVFRDDPTVDKLEEQVAGLMGKEAAMFVASGTMSNQLALRVHIGALEEVVCDYRAHIHCWEVGALHASGAAVAPIVPDPGERFLTPAAIEMGARTSHTLYHHAQTKLLSLENTLNGEVMPIEQLEATCATARQLGLACHLDGARLWNAIAATGHTPERYAAPFDTVSVCFSKGLGAPIGSVLVGSAEHIERARHYRKWMGGGWRQAGFLAAACLHALDHHRERLVEDHETAAELARGLETLGFTIEPPQTNMVWCSPPPDLPADAFNGIVDALAKEDGVVVGGAYGGPTGRHPFGDAGRAIRFVTHLQTPRATAAKALLSGLARLLKARPR